LFWEV